MDVYLSNVYSEEEQRVLLKCKCRFQENYQQYISYISNNQQIPQNIRERYRRMSSTQAIQRITNFFDRVSTGSEQNILKDNSCGVSSQSTSATGEASSLSTFNEKECVKEQLLGNSQETNGEQENDPLNEPNCIYIVLDSGIFPKRETNTDEVNTTLSQSVSSLIDMLDEDNHLSNSCITSTGSTHSSSSSDGQILPTIQIDQSDLSLMPSHLYQSCSEELHRIDVYCAKCLRQWINTSTRILTSQKKHQLIMCTRKLRRIIYDIKYINKKIDCIIEDHC